MNKIILFIIFGAILFLFAKCSFVMYSGFTDYPEYAEANVLSKKYQTLIADIDAHIENGKSILSIGASLETINYPTNTVYVALERDDDEGIVIKSHSLGALSIFTKNDFGYGTLGEQDIVVIIRPVNKLGLKDVVVYLKHKN